MLKYARNKLVNIVAKGDDRLLVHGVLDDEIYSCEINFEVKLPDMVIRSLKGRWHRYTTPDCPRALDMLDPAVGRCIRDAEFAHFVDKEVGRKGCEHFAEIIIECGHCLDQARMSEALWHALQKDPGADQQAFIRNWIDQHPENRLA